MHPDDTQTLPLSDVTGAAGDGDGFLLCSPQRTALRRR